MNHRVGIPQPPARFKPAGTQARSLAGWIGRGRLTCCLTAFGMLASAVGCGPATHDISGIVRLDGQTVDRAEVLFVANTPDRKDFAAKTGSDGVYRIRVLPGEYRVSIVADKQVPAPAGLKGPYGDTITTVTVGIIPRRYNEKTELRCTVSGPAAVDFDLASEAKR